MCTLNNANHFTHFGAQHFCRIAQTRHLEFERSTGLVIGCGEGREPSYLEDCLKIRVIGIDLHLHMLEISFEGFIPISADALWLPFKDETFDFVFFHHVLEHISKPKTSLGEIRRVLRHGGWLYIGTPNCHRLMGYISSHSATVFKKILWNIIDYGKRLRGRFRNELGAHAGFSRKNLDVMLQDYFYKIEWLTHEYLWLKYKTHIPKVVLEFLTWAPIMEFSAPALYVLCKK